MRMLKDETFARAIENNLEESIFVRCFLCYWREEGVIEHIGVGGSGGHLAPEYFNYLLIPNFPDKIKSEIVELYYNLKGNKLGIYQLDKRNKLLKSEINKLVNNIANDKL